MSFCMGLFFVDIHSKIFRSTFGNRFLSYQILIMPISSLWVTWINYLIQKKNCQNILVILLDNVKLRNFIHKNCLIDIGHLGISFTWYRRADSKVIFTRVDGALLNSHPLSLYHVLNNLPFLGSDHDPILLNLSQINSQTTIIVSNLRQNGSSVINYLLLLKMYGPILLGILKFFN